jgi:hypothetical protein
MRRFIIAGMAVAMLAIIPAAASADVARCEASITTNTTITTAKFTVLQPRDQVGQFNTVWKHDFTVIVLPDGSFKGTGDVTNGENDSVVWTEQITGTFNADKTVVSFDTIPNAGATFHLVNAPMDNTTVKVADSTWEANIIEMRVSAPVVTTATTTTPGTESVKNHGQFVKAQTGKFAAQACAGMPLNSTQGVTVLK